VKIDFHKSAIIVIDGSKRVKYVQIASPVDVDSESIIAFVESIENGTAKEYKIDEQVNYEEVPAVEEEL
jgi:hypothetical protein